MDEKMVRGYPKKTLLVLVLIADFFTQGKSYGSLGELAPEK